MSPGEISKLEEEKEILEIISLLDELEARLNRLIRLGKLAIFLGVFGLTTSLLGMAIPFLRLLFA